MNLEQRLAELEEENKRLKQQLKYAESYNDPRKWMGFKETGGDIREQKPYYDKEMGWVVPEKEDDWGGGR